MSYSSCGRPDGGSVARLTPVALGPAGDGEAPGAVGAASELRSSGAPASRPAGAPITGSPAAGMGGAGVVAPRASRLSARGAPGALGFLVGSKASECRSTGGSVPGVAAGGTVADGELTDGAVGAVPRAPS